jgi:hypothetical protein
MSNRTPTIATKMRYFAGSFWTPRHGHPASATRGAGAFRREDCSQTRGEPQFSDCPFTAIERLRGLSRTFPSYAERFVTVVQKHHRRRDSVVSCLPCLKGCRICDEGRVAQCSHQCSRIHQLWRSFFLYLPSPCSVWHLFQT